MRKANRTTKARAGRAYTKANIAARTARRARRAATDLGGFEIPKPPTIEGTPMIRQIWAYFNLALVLLAKKLACLEAEGLLDKVDRLLDDPNLSDDQKKDLQNAAQGLWETVQREC